MRRQQPYITILLLPLLLAALWGCAATDTATQLSATADEISFAEDDAVGGDTAAASPEEEQPADEDTVPEPEITAAEELKQLETLGAWTSGNPYQLEEEVTYDFPVTMNRQVEFYLDFFQTTQRDIFTRWLERSTRYLPMMQAELRKAGLPEDLAYLAMIESGFSLTAFSTAKAVGPWQFMSYTARDYDLVINKYVDERRDPEKSTRAAVAFLSDLYAMFGDWHLAVAAYNAGGGKISKGIKNYNTNDFWELAQEQYLNGETKRYVPKLIAAIIIAKNAEKYGFTNINYAPPLAYETVEVPSWTPLRAVEVACEASLEELRNLNRHLPLLVTPPDLENYPLKVPVGQKELVAKNLPRVRETVATDFKTHVVEGKETLTKICKLYNVNKTTLLKANNLRKSKLAKGQRLRIPYQVTSYTLADTEMAQAVVQQPASRLVQHKVRSGDTVASIAKRYNVSPQLVASWNSLKNIHKLKVGQQLTLHIADSQAPATIVTAKAKVSKEKKTAAKPTYYEVRNGDTLWTIARRFDLTPDQLKQWNNLNDDVIRPGTRLQVTNPQRIGPLS
ncbi:MAG: LysM peptidoglycan-binding domain-containing protein [Deltaproteobacteria bacterium]|nr:LysM peptidoglycan-binding domain-containing protein [Deltaproteobacteria bacterium]